MSTSSVGGAVTEGVQPQNELEELKRKVSELEKQVKDYEDKCEDYEDENDNLQKKLDRKKSEMSALQDKYEKDGKDTKRICKENDSLKQELEDKKDDLLAKTAALDFIEEILSAKRVQSKDAAKINKDIDFLESIICGQVLDCYEMFWKDKDGIQVGTPQHTEKKDKLMNHFAHWAAQKKKNWIDGKTAVAFVGEFSAGKTSIVNRILSQDDNKSTTPLLPVSMKATTAIPTYITGGPTKTYCFVTPDDVKKNLSEETFRKVSKEMLEQVKGVSSLIKYFVMEYKNQNLNGISILDTPGFNSNDREDKERTIEVINECDALFWVFDVNAGTINRSSITLIKEKLNKPLYVVINKTDTKSKSEVDKVEALIKKTLTAEGLSVKEFIRFSSKAPLEDIMNPIKAVKATAGYDVFVESVNRDLCEIKDQYKAKVKEANDEYDTLTDQYNELIGNLNQTIKKIFKGCSDAYDIPRWETHFFSDNCYEMDKYEFNHLKELLEDVATNQTERLMNLFDKLQSCKETLDDSYNLLVQCRQKYAQIQNCIECYSKESKKIMRYGTKSI